MKIKIQKRNYENLIVFDFDWTLAITREAILVRDKKTNEIVDHIDVQQDVNMLSKGEEYKLGSRHYFDYSEFKYISDEAEPIDITIGLLKEFSSDVSNKVIILTARRSVSKPAIQQFLLEQGVKMGAERIICTDGSHMKKGWLKKIIESDSIRKSITIFEDNINNIKMLLPLEYEFPDLAFTFVHVLNPNDEDLEEVKNYLKHMYPKGSYGTEPYQRILKKVHPAMKRKLIGLGANDYLVKGTKKVKSFSRAKSAPPSG